MSKWEYRLITSSDLPKHGMLGWKGPDREEAADYLNQLGAEGWEIVSLDFMDVNATTLEWAFRGVAKREVKR